MICSACYGGLTEEGYIDGVSVFCCNIDENTKDIYWRDF